MPNNEKTALLWGPISSFTGPLVAWMTKKGWNVHIACKSSLNLLSLSPLDLKSAAKGLIESSYQSRNRAKAFGDKIKFVENVSKQKDTKYDALIFAGLPPNFDESRGPRAPWSANELEELLKHNPETNLIVVSSIYSGVMKDGVVPEECLVSFERRKPVSSWENTCQQYESKLLDILNSSDYKYSLVRLPLICGSTDDGKALKLNGLYAFIKALYFQSQTGSTSADLDYDPDATLWFLPIDTAVYMFWRFLEDEDKPQLLNMVPTNPSLNQEWVNHLGQALNLSEITKSEESSVELSQTITKLLKDKVQVESKSLYALSGKYHIPPVITDKDYFSKVIESAKETFQKESIKKDSEIGRKIDYEKLVKLYFEDFVPSVLNTDGFIDKAIARGKEIGFKIKETSEEIWILSSEGGESYAHRAPVENKKPKVCFKLSGSTLFKLLEKKVPLHRALLLREVEVAGDPIKIVKVVRLLEKSFNENTLTKEKLEEVIA